MHWCYQLGELQVLHRDKAQNIKVQDKKANGHDSEKVQLDNCCHGNPATDMIQAIAPKWQRSNKDEGRGKTIKAIEGEKPDSKDSVFHCEARTSMGKRLDYLTADGETGVRFLTEHFIYNVTNKTGVHQYGPMWHHENYTERIWRNLMEYVTCMEPMAPWTLYTMTDYGTQWGRELSMQITMTEKVKSLETQLAMMRTRYTKSMQLPMTKDRTHNQG